MLKWIPILWAGWLAGPVPSGADAPPPGADPARPPRPATTFLQTAQDLEKRIEELESRYESRIADLEEDIEILEDELHGQGAAPSGGTRSTLMNLFNPSVSVFGNFVGRIDDKKVFTEDGDRIDNRFNLREVEIDLRAAIDPWADGVVIVGIESEVPNEFEVGIEEGYLVLKRLPVVDASPWGLKFKAGRFRASFGRMNVIHTHDLPWVTRPRSYQTFLGEEGYIQNGISTEFFIPTPGDSNALTATLQLLDGGGLGVAEEYEGADPSGVGRLAWFLDLGAGHDLEVGGSAFYGKQDSEVLVGFDLMGNPILATFRNLISQLYGVDITYRWKPYGAGEWNSFLFGIEAFYADVEQAFGPDHHPKGFFVWSQYQFTRSLYLGVRYDYTQEIFAPRLETQGWSAWLSYYTTEFLRIRVGFEHLKSDLRELDDLDSGFIEFNFVIGAHPVEPYWVNR